MGEKLPLETTGEKIVITRRPIIVRYWDRKIDSLKNHPGAEEIIKEIGFDIGTFVATLNKPFPINLPFEGVANAAGEHIEDVATESLIVNGRELDRLLVKAFPPLVNLHLVEMTQFETGGEVILLTEGRSELTYAVDTAGKSIARSDLRTELVKAGDLIISTYTPNNWTRIHGDKFTFLYFVGNPGGPQKYAAIPKRKIPIRTS